jgi:CRP/FNR family cyclic AMP-dependent transcriptional regulator
MTRRIESNVIPASIGGVGSTTKYERGQFIYRQGDTADAVFYIQKGIVLIDMVSEEGKEAVIAILEAGEFFGVRCLASQPLRTASAIAHAESVIVRIDKRAMKRALRDEPAFAQQFMAYLLSRNVQIEEDLVDQLFNSSEKRLARALLLLSHVGKSGKVEAAIPKISQEVLAARVGTTRSRVNRFLNKFRKLGFIDYNGKLTVHSALMNVIVHD